MLKSDCVPTLLSARLPVLIRRFADCSEIRSRWENHYFTDRYYASALERGNEDGEHEKAVTMGIIITMIKLDFWK